MDEEAVKTMYTLAQSQGYQDSQADFEQLLATDAKALGAMYRLAQDKGYTEDLESFEILMGLKKKEEPVVTESVSDAGSSEQRLASRDFEAERMSAFGAAGGRVVDSREVPQEGYKSPAEIAKRDSATTAINTREANIAAAQLSQRQEEAQRITADLPPVAIPEGSVTDALQQLRDLYGPYGLQFSEEKVPAAMTRAGAKVVKATVPRGAGGKPVEVRLELGEDGNIKPSEATKVDALLRENARYVGETDQSFVEKALAVQNIRPVPRIDSSGVSTVKMASAEVDGKFIAYPTLFPKDPAGTTSTNADDWMELDFGIEAQNEAFKRGEVFYFDTEEEARAFGEGAWKGVVPMDLEFQKRSQELGRDYDSDMAFLDELTERRDEYKFIEDLPPPGGRYEEGLIPASYQKYFIDGNMVRDDIEVMRDEKEAELSILEAQFDEDNVLLRLKEDRDVALGKRYEQLSTEAAEINADAKLRQNQLQAESLKNFGVRLEDLAAYEPKTEEELRGMIGLYNDYNQAASQRQAAALGYERAQTYYDKQYDKGITQDYVDGWEEVSVAWDNGWKRGEAMSKLLLMQMGYYSVIGDEGAEERAMREVSEIMDSQDPRRGRLVSRANMTGTTDSYLASIASNPGMYTAAITAESLGQLVPIWAKVLPAAAVGGAAYGAVAGPGGSILGTLGAIGATALESAFMIGMPISELALEMGNATLEVGERMGYDWSDPNSALKALNDEKLWADATQRGLERGVPIASMGVLSNFFIGAAVRRSASLASTGERVLRGAGTGLIAEPATEAIGEYMAIQTTGEYTGSTANFREIMAEAIGAVGMGVSMGASFGALGYAKQTLQESNFDLAVKLMDPMSLGAENVSGQRIMNWANKMEKLGQITPEQAEYIRKNTGYRRQANELLGRDVDARPGTKAKAVGRLMQLLEAKDHLSKPGTSFAFGRKLSEINEEISYIAENQSNRSEQVDLSLIDTRTRQSQPGAYRFNGKNVSRQDFLSKLQEATPRQLRKARAYNDSQVAAELKAKRDAISKRGTEEVPVGKRTGFGTEVDEEVREATQEDLQAEEEGSLDTDRKLDILQSIAEKLNDDTELTEVEQAFFNDNEEDIKKEQERFKALDQEAAEVEVLGEPEVEGRVPLKRLKRLAANAKKAMAKNFEGANIIIHADKDSYQQAAQENGLTGERSAGFLATDNKTVHVFAPLASETTIAHETFHVVLRNSVDKAQTQELMGEFVTTLKKVIPTDSDLAAKLDRFQKRYEEGKINEEYVAEFFGELAAAYPTLDKKGKSVIARFLERLSKLIGVDIKIPKDLTKRDQQILSLLETLSGKVAKGETITATQVSQFKGLVKPKKKTDPDVEVESVLPQKSTLGFSDKELVLQSEREFGQNGTVGVYIDPDTGEIAAVVALTDKTKEGNYLGYKRLYENGKATNKFAIKADLSTAEKGSSRPAFEAAVESLPDDHVLVETGNISSDGITLWLNQLRNNYKATGNFFTVPVNVAGTKVDLGGNPAPGRDKFNRGFFTEQDANAAEEKLNELIKDIPGAKLTRKSEANNQFSFEVTLPELGRSSTNRKKTEDNLSAAEQKVDDFSDEQIQDMAEQGVAFHFSKVDITKVLPEKLKRTIYGYGFYTTSAGQSNSVFRTYGDRVTLIDTNQLNLLNGDTRITEEQAKKLRDFAKMELEELDETGELVYFPDKAIVLQSLAELKAGAAWANVLVEGSAEAVFGDVQMVPRELASRSTRPDVITYDITQQAQVAALIQEAFGFDGADFGRGVNMDDTGYGIISAIWNFPKIDRAIIEPGQEPTRAAEQRVEFADPEMEFVYQGVTKSMLDQTFSEFLKLREREGLSKNTRKAYVTMAYEVGEVALPTAMGRRMPDNLKLASKINLDGTVEPVSADTRRLLLDAENVLKSVSRIMPELKIVVHDGSYGFQAQINNRDWIGAYSNTRKTIYINAPLSFSADNEHVLYHELFHALLDKATESPEKRAFLAHEFEMTISKVLPKDSQLLKDLREHTSKYELGLIQFEEFTVEFFGKLAASYKNQPSKVKGAIKRFIERVSNLIGYPVKFNENLTGREQDTLALLDIISKAAVEGEILAPGTLEQLAGTPTEEGPFRAGTPRAAEQRVDDLETSIDKSVGFAEESTFDNKIEFKRALQERFNQLVLPELEARYGITDSSELNDSLKEYLVDAYMNETLNAIAAYPDALGWYDSRITGAMSLMSLLHPELATDPDAASAFKIGLAITSNGNKVYDNFVEANRQYKYYKENGRFDESRSIGNQVGGILSNLKFANEALGVMSMAELTQFLTTKHKVGSLSYRDSAGKKKNLISGFGVNEEVYGAAVFGPKIGNGFFMNLYGVFDQLTMDRWFMRQYGRLTGTLLDFDQKKVDTATKRLARARKALLQRNSAKVEGLIGAFENLSDAELAQKVQKASVDIKKRAVLKSSPKLDEFRKASNNLAKLLEAEVEAPTPAKRRFINEVFSELQQKLKDENGINITIADLQAVNWYPEKALYQTFKADQTQKSAKTETSDNEQPDYESAARKLVEKQGVTKAQIDGRQIERDDTARDADQQRAAELLEDDEATSQLRDRILSIREEVTTDDLKAAEQRVDVETEGPTIVYRAGDVTDKAEPRGMMDGGRQTGHFGTGAYFFSDRKRAREYAKRTGDRDVTAVDTRDYNLAPASKELHEALRDVNSTSYREFDGPRKEDEFEMSDFIRVTRALGRYDEFFGNVQLDLAASDEVLRKQLREASAMEARQRELVREANRVYNEPGNFDSRSTVVMKTLGYEGVYATPGSNMDNSTYGTVIYDVRTEAAEQRVVDPGVVDVLERYEFKPNKSLKNAELAPELNRNLQRFGYGVKQYGTRMNDFRVISLDTGRAVDPNDIIAAGVEERATQQTEERRMVEMERQLELKQRIIEIYNADERPFTGKDFETRGVEQKVAAKAMAEPGTIADLVARGRELGLRDAAIRSVLLKRFGKDNADAIDTALTEYFDMFRAIPEAFGNVEGGIEVGRQIYDDVRRQLDEFARPKKPERMTKRERTDRIEELRAKFPEQKNLSDTELLRKHPRQAVAPSIAEVRAEALNILRNNSLFNEQTTEVQEQLLVAFDKTLQTSANKRVNTLMAQIRNNIRQRRKGESSAKAVRNELRKVINELLPAGKYTKAEAKALARLVSNVTEKNMLVQIQKVTDLLEKKAKADIKAELRDIKKLDSRIRSERKYAEREARKVQNNLRKLINEVIPRADYGKTDIAKLTRLVASVNEINYEEKAEQVLELVEKKRGQIRDSLVRDIAKFVANAAKTKRTPSGKVRPRSLDAPGQAYFREANRILRAILNKDQSLIMDIAANLANNPLVDVATQKMLNGEKLTMREQQLVDQKYALDMFAGIQDKSLEEVESILEDLKVDVGFSRANLKATRAARAARMAELREGAKAEVQDNWAGFATNEDGSAKTRNQLEADKTQKKTIGDALRENGLRAKYDALVEWAKEGKRLTPAGIARNAANITHVGALTGIMGEYFRENLYKRLGKMEERHLKGVFETKDKLDEMASTIEGIENYKDITDLIFTSNPDGLMVNTKATGRRKLSTDEIMRIYALSRNPVQQAKLEAMGFTDEVMNEIVDAVDNRLLEFVDKTVDYLANDYYEGINDVYSKVNDINLGYIENYFPTRTQVKGDLSVKSKEETLSSTFFGPNAQVATALKERTDQKGEILMSQDLGFHGELGNHFNTMERFKAYAEGVQEMNAILSSDYTVALSGRLRADAMLNVLIAHGVTPDMFMSDMSFKGVDALISNYTGASLAFKLMQIPKQATSFIGGLQQYRFGDKPNPVTDLIMFFFDYAVLVPQMMLEGVTLGKYKGPIASIAKDSATFRARLESNFSGDVYGLTAGVSGRPRKVSAKDYKLARKAAATLRKGSGTATAFGDIMGVLGYLPAYNRNRMRGMSQEEAVDLLNEYNETQQSRRPGERTPLQIRQNGLTRAFMAFTSSQILYLNNTLRHANNINKAIRKGEKVKAVDSRGLIFNAFMSSVLFTLASNIFVLLFGNDEEKERAFYDTLASPIKNLFSIPIWGAALEEFYNLYVGNEYPTDVAINPLGKVAREVKKVATGGKVSTAIKEVGELALGTNFDPGLSLINIAAGEPIEPELYNLIGVPKSQRPED